MTIEQIWDNAIDDANRVAAAADRARTQANTAAMWAAEADDAARRKHTPEIAAAAREAAAHAAAAERDGGSQRGRRRTRKEGSGSCSGGPAPNFPVHQSRGARSLRGKPRPGPRGTGSQRSPECQTPRRGRRKSSRHDHQHRRRA